MKNLLMLFLALSVLSCGKDKSKLIVQRIDDKASDKVVKVKRINPLQYYSTEVDSSWDDFTGSLSSISRKIYKKSSLNLESSVFKPENYKYISLYNLKDNELQKFLFETNDEVKLFFDTIDLRLGEQDYKGSKKSNHYMIKKQDSLIHITHHFGNGNYENSLTLSHNEYVGIKECFSKYLSEK